MNAAFCYNFFCLQTVASSSHQKLASQARPFFAPRLGSHAITVASSSLEKVTSQAPYFSHSPIWEGLQFCRARSTRKAGIASSPLFSRLGLRVSHVSEPLLEGSLMAAFLTQQPATAQTQLLAATAQIGPFREPLRSQEFSSSNSVKYRHFQGPG